MFPKCAVFINEINVNDPQRPEKNEFIEIKTDCDDMSLRGYKLIGIKAGKRQNSPASIILVVTLWNEKFKGNIYTIGGINVDKSDIKVTSDYIKFRQSWNVKSNLMSITNFLDNGIEDIYAIGLLYKKDDAMSSIQLQKNKNTIIIDEKLNVFLKNNLIDLLVYSEKCDRDRCNIFEELHPAFTKKKYTLREFNFKNDISLNRCTIETDGFIPEKFRIGKPTPGFENDCSGVYFVLEDRIQQILPKKHQNNLLPIQTIERNKVWFEYLLNKENPNKSNYRCRLCYNYYDKFKLAKNHKNALAFESGILKKTKEENREIIQKHSNIPGHKAIIDKLMLLKKETLPQDFQNIQIQEQEANNHYLEVTMRMFRTVYIEIKRNIPFEAHSALVDLQKFNGIDMGFHHFSRKSATTMTEVMSNLMHETLMKHLVAKNSPVSIILDGSTDISRTHNMIVYFLAVEDHTPVMYFYKLIECSLDQSANGFFIALKDAFSKEKVDFIQYLKNNLIGYISDGAPVMLGKNGLISKIRSMVNQPVYSVHCMAHKLHLAITKSFDKIMYFRDGFEKNIDNLIRFYNFHSTKRKAHLIEKSIHFDARLYEIHFISQTRWITSEYKILSNVKKNWFLYVIDLKDIANNKNFDKKTQEKAEVLHNTLTGKIFLSAIHFILDVLMHLSYWSQRLQERYGLLVGFSSFYKQIMDTFEHLKIDNGRYMKMFLTQAYCFNEITQKKSHVIHSRNMKTLMLSHTME